MALLTESVTHPERVLKVTDLPQAFYRWESSLKDFQRGRAAELDDDVKANATKRNLGRCGLAAAIPHFLKNSWFHVVAGATTC